MLSTAIVLVPHEPEPFVASTPFEGFMAELDRRYSASAATMASSAQWTAFPYERIVADGLWLVFVRVAEKLGHRIATPNDVLKDIAPRVNRVLNGAFSLVYPSLKTAADDFDARVAHGSDQIIESAKFFAELIKASHDMADRILRINRKLIRIGPVRRIGEESITYLGDSVLDSLSSHPDEAAVLRIEFPLLDAEPYQGANQLRKELLRLLRFTDALMELPIHLERLPQEVTFSSASIASHWISTQVLLAMLATPSDREHLTGAEYHIGMRKLHSMKPAKAMEKFFDRMRARKPTFEPEEILVRYVFDRIERMLSWDAENLDPYLTHKLFVDILSGGFATVEGVRRYGEFYGYDRLKGRVDSKVLSQAQDRFEWHKLESMHDVKANFTTRSIDLENMAENFFHIRESLRTEVLDFLLGIEGGTAKIIRSLLDNGALKLDVENTLRFQKSLTAAELRTMVPRILEWAMHQNPYPEKRVMDFLAAFDATLPKGAVEPLYGEEHVRGPFSALMLEVESEFETGSRRIGMLPRKKAEQVLHGRLTKDDRIRFALAREIAIREDAYRERDADIPYQKPWDTLGYPFTEDEMYLWVNAAEKDLKKAFAAYKKARTAYYKARKGR